MIKTIKRVIERTKQCENCHTETVPFDRFRHNKKTYCGGCLSGLLNPAQEKVDIDNWFKVGYNGKSY